MLPLNIVNLSNDTIAILYQLTQTNAIYCVNSMYMECYTKVNFVYSGTLYTMVRNTGGIELYVNTDNYMLLVGTVNKEGSCYIVRIFNRDFHTEYTHTLIYAIHKYLQCALLSRRIECTE